MVPASCVYVWYRVAISRAYLSATEAEFYYDMRKKAIATGISTKEEMGYDLAYEMEINKSASSQPVHIITRPCPLCSKPINIEQAFCHFCGVNINEKEEENKKAFLEKYEQGGVCALFRDKDIMKEAAMCWRIYGKAACLSYLKGKAKEIGLDDLEITEADMENILAMKQE